MAASLFLLRKDSLSEFVRSKRLTSQRETTNTGGSERPTAEWQPSSERADRIAKARLVSSANIGAEFKTAVKELSASLNGDWSSDELSSLRVYFKARVQDSPGIGEEYASAVGAMSDNHLTHFVKQIKRDAEHNMLEESLIQERAEFAKSRQEMIVETELTLMKESFEQNKKRIQCAANAYKSVVEAHNALGAILCSETNEAQSQAAYAGFAGKVVDVITEIEMVLGSCYDRIRNALHAQSKHLAAKLDDLCDNDERRLEQLLEQLELEEEAAAQFSCREESNRIEQAYLEFKRHWNLRLKLTFEARLCASLNALEEKAFPSLSLCTTAEEAAQIEATFVSEKQRATAELEEAFSRKEKDGLDAAESCFRSRMQLLQRRHRLEQQLRQKTHQRDKNKEVYISQTARQEALLVTEELLLCFSKFLKALHVYRSNICDAFVVFSQKTKIMMTLADKKDRQFERERAITDLSRCLTNAESVIQRCVSEAASSFITRVQARLADSRTNTVKQLAKTNWDDKQTTDEVQKQLRLLGTEEVGLHTNFLGTLATLLFDAEEAQNAAMNEVRTNAQRISALEEDRQWLWYQIKEIRGKGGNQEKKIGIMLEEYNKTKAVVESVVGEQQKRRVHDMEERSARLKRTMERRLARVAAARKKLLNGIQQMNIQQDKDFATYQQANETSEQELLEMRLKTLASISTFATLAPPLPPGASRTALVELYEATMSDSVQAKGIQANEDLLSLEESCRAQLLQIRGDIRDFSILIRLAESSYLALDDECTQLFGSSSGDSMSGFMNKTTIADEAALERGTKQFWKTTNQLELLDALQALNSRPFITSVTEDLGEFSVEFLKSGSNGGHKDDSRLSLTGESTENLKQGLLDQFDTNIRQVTEDLEDARLKAQLQMQNRLAARAARRQKASTEASNKGSTQTGRAELEAEWRAKKRAFMEQLLKRRTEERLIGRARQGDVDLRKAMELRQDQELDDLAALHLQEKVAVVLLERDIKKAELEAAHGVGELRDGTPDETEAETTARLASLEEANQGIEVSLREYLDLVMRRVSEEHTVEYDRLKCEHADQMREQFHYSEDDSRFTKLADILDCNARVNARLKEIELEQANNMQQKMEEIKRELTYGAANRRQQKTSGEDAAQQDRQRANEWRANMASKRVQSLGRRSQLRASGAHTDALLTLLRQKMDRLWEALEEERVRQQTELAMKVKQKQVARMAKFGDIQGHQQEKRNKRLTARVNRLKDIAAKRTLWKQQKQKGNPERQFSPLVQHIIEEELLSESLRQFKEENVVQFRGRFMRLLGQLELSLRGAVLPSFLAELHSVGKCTACTSQLVRDATIAGRGQNNRMKAAASESNLTSVSSRSSSVDRGNSDGYSSDHSAGGENSNSESVSGGSTSSESSSDNSSSSERSSDNSSSSESSSDNSSSSESSSDNSSSSESSSGTGSNSGSSSSGHSSSSTSSNGESDVSGHEDGGSTSSDEDNSGNRSSTSTTSKRRDSRSSS